LSAVLYALSLMILSVSAIIPVHNGARDLVQCLKALQSSRAPVQECIVVDDGSTDDSAAVARLAGATVLSTGRRVGPAAARNLGARAASGDLLFFTDADVTVHADTIEQLVDSLRNSTGAVAVIGSYDDAPAGEGFVSQYKNLQHHYVHQNSPMEAETFWSGCGMIRRDVFLEAGGFDESFSQPSIEDIELGYRLRAAKRRIILDKRAQVKHHKRWTFRSLLKTDILQRGIPWTVLSLRNRHLPNQLNVSSDQRVCVALIWVAAAISPMALALPSPTAAFSAVLLVCAVLAWNAPFYRFLRRKRGAWFAVRAAAMHVIYFFYCGLAFLGGVWRCWAEARTKNP